LAFDADAAAAASEIATAEGLYGGLGVDRVVALECRHVAGDGDLGHHIGLGRRFSPRDGSSAQGGAENRGSCGSVGGFYQWRLLPDWDCAVVTPSWVSSGRRFRLLHRAVEGFTA